MPDNLKENPKPEDIEALRASTVDFLHTTAAEIRKNPRIRDAAHMLVRVALASVFSYLVPEEQTKVWAEREHALIDADESNGNDAGTYANFLDRVACFLVDPTRYLATDGPTSQIPECRPTEGIPTPNPRAAAEIFGGDAQPHRFSRGLVS